MPASTPRLSRGMTIFLAVDAVLVAALIVVAVIVLAGGSRGGSTADDDAPAPVSTSPAGSGASAGSEASAGSGASAEPSTPSTPTSTDPFSFASPSGNISCTMSVDGVTCSIANAQYAVPGAETCSGTMGHVITVNKAGVTVPCVDGPAPAVAPPETPVLAYATSKTLGDYTCTSATNGVSCVVDATGVGFRVATAALTQLP